MIKIPEIVEQLVKERPFLEKALADNIINLTSLSRKFKPEIERRLKKEVKIGAIVMALKRLPIQPNISSKSTISKIYSSLGDIVVRSDLSEFTFRNSATLIENQLKLLKLIPKSHDFFYAFSQGVFESSLVLNQSLKNSVRNIFAKELILSQTDNLSCITIKLKRENKKIPGFYYHVLKSLAWENINILELVSTTNEFTIIVKDNLIDRSFSVLKRLKNFDTENLVI